MGYPEISHSEHFFRFDCHIPPKLPVIVTLHRLSSAGELFVLEPLLLAIRDCSCFSATSDSSVECFYNLRFWGYFAVKSEKMLRMAYFCVPH